MNTFSITLNTFEYIFNLDHELGSLATYIWGIISTIQKKLVESFLCFLNVLTSKWCIHSSEVRGLCLMKFSNEMLSKFAILIWEPHEGFHNSYFEAFRSTFLEHFLQHQSIISGDGYIVHKTTFFFISLLVMASKVLWM